MATTPPPFNETAFFCGFPYLSSLKYQLSAAHPTWIHERRSLAAWHGNTHHQDAHAHNNDRSAHGHNDVQVQPGRQPQPGQLPLGVVGSAPERLTKGVWKKGGAWLPLVILFWRPLRTQMTMTAMMMTVMAATTGTTRFRFVRKCMIVAFRGGFITFWIRLFRRPDPGSGSGTGSATLLS